MYVIVSANVHGQTEISPVDPRDERMSFRLVSNYQWWQHLEM